jgi:SARP family transcriptional regulator, regulator of embCAB operon
METTVATAGTDISVPEPERAIAMDIRLLGPLVARLNGRSFLPSATKPRQVLALLAIHAGDLVTTSAIVEELWGNEAPRSAVPSVQTYILKLRRHLAENTSSVGDSHDILATRPGGYTLDIPAELVDVNRYQDMAAAGGRALADGDYETSSLLLGTALDTWCGPALVDLPTGFLLGIEVTRLQQSRLSVLESRIEADLRLGRHHQLLEQLAELTARYPMHEKLCIQYMTALSACGMKWRALEVFGALRMTLVRELGIEPSFQVQRLQRVILNSDIRPHEHMAALPTSSA